MVDIIGNIRHQNSIYYNNYNVVNQVFKATLFLLRIGESVLCGVVWRWNKF
jgi:hypothetical protein